MVEELHDGGDSASYRNPISLPTTVQSFPPVLLLVQTGAHWGAAEGERNKGGPKNGDLCGAIGWRREGKYGGALSCLVGGSKQPSSDAQRPALTKSGVESTARTAVVAATEEEQDRTADRYFVREGKYCVCVRRRLPPAAEREEPATMMNWGYDGGHALVVAAKQSAEWSGSLRCWSVIRSLDRAIEGRATALGARPLAASIGHADDAGRAFGPSAGDRAWQMARHT